MEIVKIFKIYISDNAIQRKKSRENSEKSSNYFKKSVSKNLEKRFQNLKEFGADISTNIAEEKFKKSKRLKI
jgi:hypothetical protein